MITIFKQLIHLFIGAMLIMLVSCSEKRDVFQEAKNKLNTAVYLNYTSTAHFPVPDTKLVDTAVTKVNISYKADNALGYIYIEQKENKDFVFTDNSLTSINHKTQTNRVYLPEHFNGMEGFYKAVDANFKSRWSPIVFMQEAYQFKTDTIINGKEVKDYVQIKTDTVINNQRIYTEHHVFIDEQALINRFERRNYNDGSLSQRITFNFSDFNFTEDRVKNAFNVPGTYVTLFGQSKRLVSKKIGEEAPDFTGVTMAGDEVKLSDFKGQKVLLNFSVINCGNCKATLDYINQDNYEPAEDIPILYINPEDDNARMSIYREDTNIPFPVINSAKTIATDYGVNSYPRFFLVDEDGVIEHVEIGFSETFLDQFNATIQP